MGFETQKINDHISLILETGVSDMMRCNIWHVRGRDYDLVIDTGFGLSPLKDWVRRESDRPIKAICTHSHFDHMGGLHEFCCRLGHKAEANIYAQGGREATLYTGAWTEIEIIDRMKHPDFDSQTFTITPAPLTGYLDEGDVLDLGDRAYQVLHLPGHSPGSIGLWDIKEQVLFSGGAVYDGDLLDSLVGSNKDIYAQTLNRLLQIAPQTVHGGHYGSFGANRMRAIIESYFKGEMVISDINEWYKDVT